MPVVAEQNLDMLEATVGSMTHLPEGVSNVPLGIVGSLAVAGIFAYQPTKQFIGSHFGKNRTSSSDHNTNPFNSTISSAGPAIEAVLHDAPIESEQADRVAKQMRRRRGIAAGGLVLGAAAMYGPYYTDAAPVAGSTVILRDTSLSFLHTADGSEGTRIATANSASTTAFSASGFPESGNSIYLIDFAKGAKGTPKLETQDDILAAIETAPTLNPNGGDFTEALELAKGIIGQGTPDAPSGNIIIATDGAFDDKKTAARELGEVSKTSNLTVLHIGKDPAAYQLPGVDEEYDSSANKDYLKKLKPEDATIIESVDATVLSAALDEQLAATAYSEEQRPWITPLLLAAGLLTTASASLYKLAQHQLRISKTAKKKQ